MRLHHAIADRLASILLWAVCLALLVATIGTMTRTWQAVPVLSGSMEPALSAGDLVVARNQPADEAEVGDVIIFHAPTTSAVTVHRIASLRSTPEGPAIVTRGDANDVDDRWGEFVLRSDRVWTVRRAVPGLGRAVLWARGSTGQALALGLLVLASSAILASWRVRRLEAPADAAIDQGAEREDRVSDRDTVDVAAPELRTPSPPSDTLTSPRVQLTRAGDGASARRLAPDARAWQDVQAALTSALDLRDPEWSWRPLQRNDDGTPRFSLGADGRPHGLAIELTLSGRTRAGLGIIGPDRENADAWILTHAVADAASHHGVCFDVEERRAGRLLDRVIDLTDAPPAPAVGRRRPIGAQTSRVVGALALALLVGAAAGSGLGPAASATLSDRAQDELTIVTTATLGPPTRLVATTDARNANHCDIVLTWSAATGGPDGHVIERQRLTLGESTWDGAEPTAAGPWEVIARVDGSTEAWADRQNTKSGSAREGFRYRVSGTLAEWQTGPSNGAETTTADCVSRQGGTRAAGTTPEEPVA